MKRRDQPTQQLIKWTLFSLTTLKRASTKLIVAVLGTTASANLTGFERLTKCESKLGWKD